VSGLLDKYQANLLASAAQAPGFDEVRAMRERDRTLQGQRALALEDRRAFAREYVQRNPVQGSLAMLVLPPAEQVYKGVNHLVGREVGRSGFFAPLANIGAAYQGALEGLATRGRK
jgi:hypothetical protein